MTIYDVYGEIQALMCDPRRDHLLEFDLSKELYRSHLQLAVDLQELHPARTPEIKHLCEKAVEDFFARFKCSAS